MKIELDVRLIKNKTNKGLKRVFNRFGSFVRRRAQSSIRKRKRISLPGSAPSGHTGQLKKSILFAYDSKSYSVIIGPVAQGKRVGELLELGGVSGKKNYQPRPFMRPAFEIELANLPKILKNFIE